MRALRIIGLAVLLVASGAAFAQGAPKVTMPAEGALLGPNYDIIGSMDHKAFLVLITDVVRADTNEVIRSVPGIRHWTAADGTFHFRAASPRVSIGERGTRLLYHIRLFEATQNGNGPETVITCGMADQQ